MPARKKISARQMELLLEFAESRPDIALGRFPAGPRSSEAVRMAWEAISSKLNSIGEGSTKTPSEWRRYWIEFKARTKTKAADSRRMASLTGGGPNKFVPLNKIEERVIALIGAITVEGLQGVSIPVEDHSSAEPNPSTSTAPDSAPISSEPYMEEEWLDSPPLMIQQIPQSNTPESTVPATAPPQDVAASSLHPVDPSEQMQNEEQRLGSPQMEAVPEVQQHSSGGQSNRGSSSRARTRSLRQVMRDERVPRWAYELELRRISLEERLVTVLQEMRDDNRAHNANLIALLRQYQRPP